MQQVFISYSRLDELLAKRLHTDISNQGFSPWFDKISLLPGQTWENEVKSAIRKSSFVILLLSKNSLDRKGYFHKEIQITLDLLDTIPAGKIFLIPARLDDCSVPESLGAIQWVDMFPEWDTGFEKICEALFYQRTQEIVSKPIENLAPLPDEINIIPPARNIPVNIAAFSGHWIGRWGGVLPSQLVVEEVGISRAIVIYSWGEHPSGKFREGWSRDEAKVSPPGVFEFGKNPKFTFRIDKTSDTLHGIREAAQSVDKIIMKRKQL